MNFILLLKNLYLYILITINILCVLDFFKIRINIKKKIALLLLLLLSIVDGIRNETGPDWFNYLKHYKRELESIFEIGYTLVENIFIQLKLDYNLFLFFISLFLYLGLFFNIFKLSRYKILGLFILYYLFVPYIGINRQMISLTILSFSVKYYFENKNKKFIIIILLSSLFHISSLLFAVLYFFKKIKLIKKVCLKSFVGLVVFFFLKENIGVFLEILKKISIFDKYISYFLYEKSEKISYFGLVMRIIEVYIPMLFLMSRKGVFINSSDKKIIEYCFVGLYVSLMIYILGYGQFQILVSRGTFIFKILLYPIYCSLIFQNINRIKKVIFLIFIMSIGYLSIYKSIYSVRDEIKKFYEYKIIKIID